MTEVMNSYKSVFLKSVLHVITEIWQKMQQKRFPQESDYAFKDIIKVVNGFASVLEIFAKKKMHFNIWLTVGLDFGIFPEPAYTLIPWQLVKLFSDFCSVTTFSKIFFRDAVKIGLLFW